MTHRIWQAFLVLIGRRVAVMPDDVEKHKRLKATNRLLATKLHKVTGGDMGYTAP